MKKTILALVILGALVAACKTLKNKSKVDYQEISWPKYTVNPPTNWQENIFEPSHNFPKELSVENKPWDSIDFKTNPEKYMKEVLQYCFDGNIKVDFNVLNNKKRDWYHVPYMTTGTYGREPLRGLTRERSSEPYELSKTQSKPAQNWAIGYFNNEGGYAIGQVWQTPNFPSIKETEFPNGSVSFKLLFTSADTIQIPYLTNSLTWDIYMHKGISCKPNSIPSSSECSRMIDKVRLLQVDIAVKDVRADKTGWVFGTYVYNDEVEGKYFWEKLKPVGLMWGNDPEKKVNEKLIESITFNTGLDLKLGCNSRLNGPVDNPNSSCISCHSKAGYPYLYDFGPEKDCNKITEEEFRLHFQNIKYPDVYTNKQKSSLDYSLQLAMSIANFQSLKDKKNE